MPNPADPAEDVDRYAELSARLADPHADRPAILREAGLDVDRWKVVTAGWAGRFADGGAIAQRFTEVFNRTLGMVTAPAVPLTQPAAAPGREEAVPVEMAVAAPPSALRSAPPPPPVHALAATTGVDFSAMRPALPFRPRSSPPNPLGDTLEAGTRLPLPALPFTKPPPLPAPPPRAPAPPSPAPPAAAASTHGAPEVPNVRQPTGHELAETELPCAFPIPRDPLPFVEPAQAVGGPGLAEVRPLSEPRPPGLFTGTVEGQALPVPGRVMPFGASAQVPRKPLPVAGSTEPVLEGLTLQQHAELCADLAARPADVERIFAAHGLADANKRRAVNDAWLTYLGTDAAAYAHWQAHYRRYVSGAR